MDEGQETFDHALVGRLVHRRHDAPAVTGAAQDHPLGGLLDRDRANAGGVEAHHPALGQQGPLPRLAPPYLEAVVCAAEERRQHREDDRGPEPHGAPHQ